MSAAPGGASPAMGVLAHIATGAAPSPATRGSQRRIRACPRAQRVDEERERAAKGIEIDLGAVAPPLLKRPPSKVGRLRKPFARPRGTK